MGTTPSEILNIRSKAESDLASAIIYLGGGGHIEITNEISLDELQAFFDKFKFYDYNAVITDITAYLANLNTIIGDVPIEPPSIGVFSIVDPPVYVPTDLSLMRTALNNLLAVIDTIPSKIANAVAIADALYTLLITDLQVGGYGINEVDELALYNRVRDRETLASGATVAELRNKAAALGYTVPPGALDAAIKEAVLKAGQNMSEANREIYNKRAELYRDNRKFTIEQAQVVSKFYVEFTSKKADMLQIVATTKLDEAKLEVQGFLGALQAWEGKLNKILKEQDLLGKVYELRTSVWNKKIEGQATAVNAINTSNQTEAAMAHNKALLKLEEIKTALNKEQVELNTWLSRIQAIAAAYTASVSAGMGAVNGIVSYITESTED
jgi:hypothetical protein